MPAGLGIDLLEIDRLESALAPVAAGGRDVKISLTRLRRFAAAVAIADTAC